MGSPLIFDIRPDDLSGEPTRDLLAFHLRKMHQNSPEGSVFALNLSGLRESDVRVWSAWKGPQIACVGALKSLQDGGAELKSMRTHPDFLRQGAASALLEHIIAIAAQSGAEHLSLETGSGDAFEPALALYRRRGFANGAAFADYEAGPFNQFLHLAIPASAIPAI